MQNRRPPRRNSLSFLRDDSDGDIPMASTRRPGKSSDDDDFDVVDFLDEAIQMADNRRDAETRSRLRELRQRWTENSDNVLPNVVEFLNASKHEAEQAAYVHKMWMKVIGHVQDRTFKSMAQRQTAGSSSAEGETAMKQLKLVNLTIELEAQQARSDFIRTRLRELQSEVTGLDEEHDEIEKRTDAIQKEISRLESRK